MLTIWITYRYIAILRWSHGHYSIPINAVAEEIEKILACCRRRKVEQDRKKCETSLF